MSYRNPKYTYISDAPELQRMQQSMTSSVVAAGKERKAEEATEKAQKSSDRMNRVAWDDKLLSANQNGGEFNKGVLDKTYEGSGKRYAELQRMMKTGEGCESEDCIDEEKELSRLKAAPGQTIKMLGNLTSNLDVLKEGNIDKNQPLYARLETAQKIIDGELGYGEKQGYSMEVILDDNGDQQIVFNGPGMGEDGESGAWNINSANLEQVSLLQGPVNIGEEFTEISQTSPLFDKDTIDPNGNFTNISPKYLANRTALNFNADQQTAFDKAKEANPKLTEDEFAKTNNIQSEVVTQEGTNPPQPVRKIEWVEQIQDGPKGQFKAMVPYYSYDDEAMRASIVPQMDATVKASFGINADGSVDAQGPNEAFQLWNQPNDGLHHNIPEEVKDKPWFTEDGKLNYDSLNDKKCPLGSECSAYNKDGTMNSELIDIFTNVMTDKYMRQNVEGGDPPMVSKDSNGKYTRGALVPPNELIDHPSLKQFNTDPINGLIEVRSSFAARGSVAGGNPNVKDINSEEEVDTTDVPGFDVDPCAGKTGTALDECKEENA